MDTRFPGVSLMPLTLENAALQFALSPATAEWSLFSRHRNGPAVEKARLGVTCRRGAARIYALEKWEPYEIEGPARVDVSPRHARAARSGKRARPGRAALHPDLCDAPGPPFAALADWGSE